MGDLTGKLRHATICALCVLISFFIFRMLGLTKPARHVQEFYEIFVAASFMTSLLMATALYKRDIFSWKTLIVGAIISYFSVAICFLICLIFVNIIELTLPSVEDIFLGILYSLIILPFGTFAWALGVMATAVLITLSALFPTEKQ